MIKGLIFNGDKATLILQNGVILPYFHKDDPIIKNISKKSKLNKKVVSLIENFEEFRTKYRDYINDKFLFEEFLIALKTLDKSRMDKLYRFAKKLIKNPDDIARQTLFKFLTDKSIEIDNKGYIVAYKAVRSDLYDIYSGTIQYKLNKWIEIPREIVDPNPQVACSTGLHIGTLYYARRYGLESSSNKLLKVIVDPKDVVVVPQVETEKCRVCRLKAVEIIEDKGDIPDVIRTRKTTYVLKDKPIKYKTKRKFKLLKQLDESVKLFLENTEIYRLLDLKAGRLVTTGLLVKKDGKEYYYATAV